MNLVICISLCCFLLFIQQAGMDKIVFGLANITFRENCDEILAENRTPIQNSCNCISYKVMSATAATTITNNATIDDDASISKPEKSDEDDASGEEDTSSNVTRYSLRKSRASKENTLHKVQHRSIAKPVKKSKSYTVCTHPSDFEKIYMTKSISNFRPTNLETIFEEPQYQKAKIATSSADSCAGSNILNLIGGRKLRRSLSCSDGSAANKTLIKQRRAKIKRLFGRRFALQKIALDDFMQHLKTNIGTESTDEEESNDMSSAAVFVMEHSEASDA